ncbi:hypothetical protein DSO57_1000474 [Entomophthora muscae]|uniref:Uncharacterized protein n=1 Tax=Entomophthora muscae TaxID=34485 RepID=A0ACC2UUA1_9FUNG|nr:hypothetical protein DSO57_1000474 [Entomophthora muscae]
MVDSKHCLKIQEPNSAKPQTPTAVMIENITTQKNEINHQSTDHNNLLNHAITGFQCNSLLLMEATQSAPSGLSTMKMRPDATDPVPSQVPSQDSLIQFTANTLMNPCAQCQAKVPGSLPPLPVPLQVPMTKGWETGALQKASSSLFQERPTECQMQTTLNELYDTTFSPDYL